MLRKTKTKIQITRGVNYSLVTIKSLPIQFYCVAILIFLFSLLNKQCSYVLFYFLEFSFLENRNNLVE